MVQNDKSNKNVEIKRMPLKGNSRLLTDYWSVHIQDWQIGVDDLMLFVKDAMDSMWLYLAYQDNQCVGMLVNEEHAEGSAMWLLHVAERYRYIGVGSSLFSAALQHVRGKWTAGLGTGYWWQGVPEGYGDRFLENRGFQWTWTSIDMIRSLDAWTSLEHIDTAVDEKTDQNVSSINIPDIGTLQPQEGCALIQMLKEEKDLAGWVRFYQDMIHSGKFDRILVARSNMQLVGCAMVLEERDIRWGKELEGKVGGIGCIGVKEKYREQGIGTALVSAVNKRLKSLGYSHSYVGYTWLEDWYGEMGYQVYKRFRMGERNSPS